MSAARLRFFLTRPGGRGAGGSRSVVRSGVAGSRSGCQGFLREGIEKELELAGIQLLRGAPEELAGQGIDLEPQHFFLLLETLVFIAELAVLLG